MSSFFGQYNRKIEVSYIQYLDNLLKELRRNPEVDLAIKLIAIKNYATNSTVHTRDIAGILDVSEGSIIRWVNLWNESLTEELVNRTLKKRYEKILDKICKERCKNLEEKK